jgi:beta-galactosidase
MWCYYNNADEVELFVNGCSKGVRRKGEHDYHVCWRVEFESGEVKVVARNGGKVVGEKSIKTAGQPYAIRLTADKSKPHANGLVFVTAEVVDEQGNLCPWAENELLFSVEGDARIVGVDNGVQTSLERFVNNKRKAANGKALVVLQVGKKASDFKLTARAIGLKAESKMF